MPKRELSAAHKAALHAGRDRARVEQAEKRVVLLNRRQEEFSRWSKAHAKAWAKWREECGKTRCDCEVNKTFRTITSAIPKWV